MKDQRLVNTVMLQWIVRGDRRRGRSIGRTVWRQHRLECLYTTRVCLSEVSEESRVTSSKKEEVRALSQLFGDLYTARYDAGPLLQVTISVSKQCLFHGKSVKFYSSFWKMLYFTEICIFLKKKPQHPHYKFTIALTVIGLSQSTWWASIILSLSSRIVNMRSSQKNRPSLRGFGPLKNSSSPYGSYRLRQVFEQELSSSWDGRPRPQ